MKIVGAGLITALFLVLILGMVMGTALRPGPARAGEPLAVAASIEPQRFFLERLGGDLVRVQIMLPPGADPHTFEPRPSSLAALSRTGLYFSMGVAFERAWLSRFMSAAPGMRVADCARGLKRLPAPGRGLDVHGGGRPDHGPADGPDHGPADVHDHGHGSGGTDPHLWLSPALARGMAWNMAFDLAQADPENARQYEANLAALVAEVDALDAELHSLLDPFAGRPFLVFHPSWGYFAHDYGLIQVAMESGGREPGPRELASLVDFARDRGLSAVFVQPQVSDRAARVLAREIGAVVVVADPLSGDWAENLRLTARLLVRAMKSAGEDGP